MPNDNVREYVLKHPDVNRFELITDIATGLNYLHGKRIVHGDLKGGNVVVSATGTCRLVDFGLAKKSEKSLGVSNISTIGTSRWMAPELMDPSCTKAPVTFASDIYALGMEILTGSPPFEEYERDMRVIAAVGHGKIPERPSVDKAPDLSDAFWQLLKACWAFHPVERPSAAEVMNRISELAGVPAKS
ncbi:hypothetical protein FRC07_001475 [Ceratobasidium sp. 392]|nr:hypothetical protein FRC07_001475 [Ceratobasidium sp. 392]